MLREFQCNLGLNRFIWLDPIRFDVQAVFEIGWLNAYEFRIEFFPPNGHHFENRQLAGDRNRLLIASCQTRDLQAMIG